jgi:hypothetical protein
MARSFKQFFFSTNNVNINNCGDIQNVAKFSSIASFYFLLFYTAVRTLVAFTFRL